MGLTELIAIAVSAVLGWQSGSLGQREIKAVAIIVLGWTAVTTLADLRDISLVGIFAALIFRTLLIGMPYTLAALAKQVQRRRR